jgi:hypothetical protein
MKVYHFEFEENLSSGLGTNTRSQVGRQAGRQVDRQTDRRSFLLFKERLKVIKECGLFFMILHNEVYCMKYGTLSCVLLKKCLCHNTFI